MNSKIYHLPIQIFYEDTDHSGFVYHPNYLKYFERAREHIIGSDNLVKMWKEDDMGFVVYKADLMYLEGAEFGDILDIRTTYNIKSEYRIIWRHEAWKVNRKKPAVTCDLHLVCTDKNKKPIEIPLNCIP